MKIDIWDIYFCLFPIALIVIVLGGCFLFYTKDDKK